MSKRFWQVWLQRRRKFPARTIPPKTASRLCAARPRNSATNSPRLHGDQAQAEQTLAHHIESVTRHEQQEQQLLEESLHHRERAQAADLHWQSVLERTKRLEELVRNAQARIADLRHQQQEATARAGDFARCSGRRPGAACIRRTDLE